MLNLRKSTRSLWPGTVLLMTLTQPLSAQVPSRETVLEAMRQASQFFAERVARQGGYQGLYSHDLTYGNAGKGSEGLTRISVTGGTTPSVGLAFLRAWETTRDPLYRRYARDAGYALLQVQNCSGGWDYTGELDPAKRPDYLYRTDRDCVAKVSRGLNMTNLDNDSTQQALRFLMRLDRELQFQDEPIHSGARYALKMLTRAQYPNGAWPQRYDRVASHEKHPVQPAAYPESWSKTWPGPIFYAHYTLNDEVSSNMIDVLLEAGHIYQEPAYRVTAEKAGDFLILAQMPQPQPGWGQQYDVNMHPAWGRVFEPPGVTGRESLEVLDTLLRLYRETAKRKYLTPVAPALDYLRRSVFEYQGERVLARYHEFKTNRPLFVTRGTLVGTGVRFGQPTDGYQVVYDPAERATHYAYLGDAREIDRVQEEYERVLRAAPSSLRRPVPRDSRRPAASPEQLADRVAAAIAFLDDQGRWIEEGDPGGPGRLVRVRAARNLVAMLDGKRLSLIPDGSTLEIFEGTVPPSRRVIRTATFSANLQLFCDYLASM